jgi:hypothetical protein
MPNHARCRRIGKNCEKRGQKDEKDDVPTGKPVKAGLYYYDIVMIGPWFPP